jgi:hypothetical protein
MHMPHNDISKTSADFEPPPRGLNTGIWLGAVIVVAAVILGVFVWSFAAGSGATTQASHPQVSTTTGQAPANR